MLVKQFRFGFRKEKIIRFEKPLKNRIFCIFDIFKTNMYKQFKVLISTQ